MSPRLRCALLVAICLCSLRARGDEREVRMPLTDYEELRDSVRDKLRAAREPKPGVAVIDRLTLSGSFAHSDLLITLTGRATANAEPLNFMDDSLRLHACEGQGPSARPPRATS